MKVTAALVVLLAMPMLASTATATPTLNIERCLQLTTTTSLRTGAIMQGLGLTPEQVKEVRFRLASYHSARGFPGLEDIDLTAEQKAEIMRRINAQVAAMNRYPLGWPCKPFANPTRVVAFMKTKLVANGYRPAMRWTKTSPRQFQFRAIQDGVEQFGVVVKSGPRQITVRLQSVSPRWGRTYTFTVGFEA